MHPNETVGIHSTFSTFIGHLQIVDCNGNAGYYFVARIEIVIYQCIRK